MSSSNYKRVQDGNVKQQLHSKRHLDIFSLWMTITMLSLVVFTFAICTFLPIVASAALAIAGAGAIMTILKVLGR